VIVLGGSFAQEAAGHHPRRIGVGDFMAGLACVESGGRFDAVNGRSGALGKYQFMPKIWVAWAGRYLGNRWAGATPRNQEFVARERILDLYERHHSWRLVAHWWRTGNAPRDERTWSRGSLRYVNAVMAVARLAAADQTRLLIPARCLPTRFKEPRVRTEPWPLVRVTGKSVYLRRGPGVATRAFEVVRRGARLAVLGHRRERQGIVWLRVGLRDGRTGWIVGRLVAPIGRG
jgi:hypothetical protein